MKQTQQNLSLSAQPDTSFISDGREALPSELRPTLSACLIVRNEAHCLASCLESLTGVVDEIIVVDTGSTDQTVAIARRYTEKIFHHPWNHHFAEARNVSLAQASGDWILIIDADEVLPVETARLIPSYLKRQEFMNQSLVLNWRVRSEHHPDLYSRGLFPNGHGLRFAGRVHEIPVLPGQSLPTYHCQDLVLLHKSSGERNLTKQRYYQRLMRQNLAEVSDLALTNHLQKHLGLSHLALEEWQAGWDVLSDCYRGMHELGIRPEDGFYQDVLRGLVQAGSRLSHPSTYKYALEFHQMRRADGLAGPSGKVNRSYWRKGMVAVTMSLLAACQSSPPALKGQISQSNPTSSLKANQKPLHGKSHDLAYWRQKYGPFVQVGIDSPSYQAYLQSQTHGLPPKLDNLFRIQGYTADTSQCRGTVPGSDLPYNGLGSLYDLGLVCDERGPSSGYGAISSCYSSGGIPVWTEQFICNFVGSSSCFRVDRIATLHECEGAGGSDGGGGGGSGGGGGGGSDPEPGETFCSTETYSNGDTSETCFTCPSGATIQYDNGKIIGCTGVPDSVHSETEDAPFGIQALNRQAVFTDPCNGSVN